MKITQMHLYELHDLERGKTKTSEGQFTCWKRVRDFFRTKGFIRIFDGYFLKTKGFLPKVYEIFWSEMPLENKHILERASLG